MREIYLRAERGGGWGVRCWMTNYWCGRLLTWNSNSNGIWASTRAHNVSLRRVEAPAIAVQFLRRRLNPRRSIEGRCIESYHSSLFFWMLCRCSTSHPPLLTFFDWRSSQNSLPELDEGDEVPNFWVGFFIGLRSFTLDYFFPCPLRPVRDLF